MFVIRLVRGGPKRNSICLFQPNDHYSATKAEGETLVIKANGTNGLLTCCIRPSSIFGPGDRLLVPTLVDTARKGKSKVDVVFPSNGIDFSAFIFSIFSKVGNVSITYAHDQRKLLFY